MDMISDKIFWNNMAGRYDRHTKKSSKIYERIFELLAQELFNEASVLDIGTGTGEIPLTICHNVNTVEAIDSAEEMIETAKTKASGHNMDNVTFRVYDGIHLPYTDKAFDIVIMSNVLHIIPSPENMLSEVFRVLKDTGKIILPTYLHDDSWKTRCISWIFKKKGHPIYTRFSSGSLKKLVEQTRFHVTTQIYIKSIMPASFIVARKVTE